MLDFRAASNVALWLIGAVILHDLILLPLYSARRPRRPARAAGHPHQLRARPGGLSLLMLLVFWRPIRGKGAGTFARVSGLEYDGYVLALAARHRGAVRDLRGGLLRARQRTGRQPAA